MAEVCFGNDTSTSILKPYEALAPNLVTDTRNIPASVNRTTVT